MKSKERIRFCQYCGEFFYLPHGRKGNAMKYCSVKCRRNARLEKNLKAVRKYQKLYKWLLKEKPNFNQYSGRLGANPSDDFEEELRLVENELKRFKIH